MGDLLTNLKSTEVIIKEVINYEGFGCMKYKDKEDFTAILQQGDKDHREGLHRLNKELAEILQRSVVSDEKDAENMENDEYCRVSVVITMLNKVVRGMGLMQQLAVKSM